MNIWTVIIAIEVVVITFLIWTVWSAVLGAPWAPASKSKVRTMLEFANVGEVDTLYDLGSGDGRIIIMTAKEFGAKAVGIEADSIRSMWSKLVIRHHKLKDQVQVSRGNFFNFDIGEASVITLYLGVGANTKLREKLAKELKPGTRIVFHYFVLKDCTPTETNENAL